MNMKTFNNLFSALMFFGLMQGLGACTDECDYMPAQPLSSECPKASFITDSDFMELNTDAPKSITITVTRENTEEDVTLALNVLQNDENIFQIPESVTLAAGQNTATFEIAFPNAEIGLEYTYSISLDADAVDPYAENSIASTTGTIQIIQWDLLGTGSLTCTLLGEMASCSVYKASHAAWYRAEEPIEADMDILFIVNDDNSVTVADQPIFTDANYGTVYVNNAAGGGIYDAQTNTIQVAFYYYCSAGYFGTFAETLTLPAAQ